MPSIKKIKLNNTDYNITDAGAARAVDATLTGTPTAPTAVSGTDTTQIATTEFVQDAVDNIDLSDLPTATTTTNGLMSSTDKAVLDNLNPNVEATATGEDPTLYITNAKPHAILDGVFIIGPVIESRIRTSNLLDVSDTYGNYYIGANGALNESAVDVLGPFMAVSPGDDIYYTGIVGATTASQVNRRLHVYDSNQN